MTTYEDDVFQPGGEASDPSSDTKGERKGPKLAAQAQAFIQQLQYNKVQR